MTTTTTTTRTTATTAATTRTHVIRCRRCHNNNSNNSNSSNNNTCDQVPTVAYSGMEALDQVPTHMPCAAHILALCVWSAAV